MDKTAASKPRAGPRLPSLDLLKGFEAAARQLSFTRAAEELFLTQSALSRQIQTLEEQIGVALFERRHRELRLTDAGQILQATARSVLDELAQAVAKIRREQNVAAADRLDQPVVRFAVADSAAGALSRAPSGHRRVHLRRQSHRRSGARAHRPRRALLHRCDGAARRGAAVRRAPAAGVQSGARRRPRAPTRRARGSRAARAAASRRSNAAAIPWLNWSVWLAANGMRRTRARRDRCASRITIR